MRGSGSLARTQKTVRKKATDYFSAAERGDLSRGGMRDTFPFALSTASIAKTIGLIRRSVRSF